MNKYEQNSVIFKALSEPKRLMIIDLLSCEEKCACELLEYFNFTQPTLSHHMKTLIDCGLVEARKEGTWSYYSLNNTTTNRSVLFFLDLVTNTDGCICKNK